MAKIKYFVTLETTDKDGWSHDYPALIHTDSPLPDDHTELINRILDFYSVDRDGMILDGWQITSNMPIITL